MTAPRVVLDSKVHISALLFGGCPAQVLERALDGSIRCFVSAEILDELRNVLRRPRFGLSPEQALAFVEEVRDVCRLVTPAKRIRVVQADPGDDRVLECALAAKADTIVSSDSHLLALGSCRGIRILSPAEFMRGLKTPKS